MNECQKLREAIHQHDFALIEADLFLDTHPDNRKALAVRRELMEKRRALIEEYTRRFGPYIVTAADVTDTEHWAWIDGPWPWEESECDA